MAVLKDEKINGWNETTNNYQQSGPVTLQDQVFALIATNVGDTNVRFNGKILFPSTTPASVAGDSYTIADPRGKIYKGNIKVQFDFPSNANPQLEITQLYYLTDESIKGF